MEPRIASDQASPGFPATREACQARLAELASDIAAIKTQLATIDLDRQAGRGQIDARWFNRAKTALRHKQREIAEITVHMVGLPMRRSRRDSLKDCLIAVLRRDYDDVRWRRALDAARDLHDLQETA